MLAKVHQFPTLAEDPSTQSIEVNFNPYAVPLASQFTFTSSTGKRYLMVDEPTTISVKLKGGATFSSVPVFWPNPPSNGAPAVIMKSDSEISFLVPAPTHYFVPGIFGLNVNFGHASNITSPSFFLVKTLGNASLGGSPFTLAYNADGSFALQRLGSEADIEFASQRIMHNVLGDKFTVVLKGAGATFHENPIVWSNGNVKPDWVDVATDPVEYAFLEFSFPKPVNGQSAGFQFAIDLPNGSGNTLTILSPDPIIINATIGDG
jgi:hypothetical protein